MLTRVIENIANVNNKVALIIIDGMSIFDFNIISSKLIIFILKKTTYML